MSRGAARTALCERIEQILDGRKLPYRGGEDGEVREVRVFEQYGPIVNDEVPDAPCVIVHLGKVDQMSDTRTGAIGILAVTYANDSEQGYRDAENLIEAIEVDLISDPWIEHIGDGARYELVGPWSTDIPQKAGFPTSYASLDCTIVMQPIECIIGPSGRAISEEI